MTGRHHPFRLYLVTRFVAVLPESRLFGLKRQLYRLAGIKVGAGTRICSSVVFHTGNVEIGHDVWIGPGCRVIMPTDTRLTIGDNVDLAMEVLIIGGSHVIGDAARRAGAATRGDITIGPGAWLGARAIVLPGVQIGAGAVLAAASVVKGDVPDNCLFAGDPARLVRHLADRPDAARDGADD